MKIKQDNVYGKVLQTVKKGFANGKKGFAIHILGTIIIHR